MEDWEIGVDGVRRVTGHHLENCHAVIDSVHCDGGPAGGGGGRDLPCNNLQCCLSASQDAANRRTQAILQGQRSCVASLGSFANQVCTGLVTSIAWTNIDTNTFNRYSSDFCERPPRRSARESEDHYWRRYDEWHRGCQQSIAASLTARDRSRCLEDLRRGSGDFWNKFIIHAGPLGSFGWDIGNNQDQGFEAACNQQTNQLLLDSNKKKTEDDISCQQKYGGRD
jgi:hypothetical protein